MAQSNDLNDLLLALANVVRAMGNVGANLEHVAEEHWRAFVAAHDATMAPKVEPKPESKSGSPAS